MLSRRKSRAVRWMKNYLRLVDFVGAAQLYLKDNFLLEEPLKPEHVKERILGHWGTVPGINFIYAGLNFLAHEKKCEMLLVTGPGHGAPANLANLFMEGSLKAVYPEYTVDERGMGRLIRDFSWPFSHFPSHVTPSVPGSILEGGELGYSLATAFGAAMDNPNLIVPVIVGDGEAESGPLSAAWFSNKFLSPKTSGAVLPILHVNGFKISNPTIYGSMDNDEIRSLFKGHGYSVHIVEGMGIEMKYLSVLEKAYAEIRALQKRARSGKKVLKPKWPMIVLRTPKGWKGIRTFSGKAIEGSFRSHGVPIEGLKEDPKKLQAVEAWLKSYKAHQFFDEKGKIDPKLFAFVPSGKTRLGQNKHAVGGNLMKELKWPKLEKYEMKLKKHGAMTGSSMREAAFLFRDLFKNNPTNFRMFCPDEMESNQLHSVFEATQRAYQWPILKNAEDMGPEGRVMEMLSEHSLQGWMQGYLLTGRHGIFVTYEAFATIISSMVDQYAKFLKQSSRVAWRKPVPNAVYVLSSVGWRQEHNGYSHQNPGFVSNLLQKHGEFTRIFYPADANSTLVAIEEAMCCKNGISVIVAGKRPLLQWQSLEDARKQSKDGMAIWEWVSSSEACKNPDVVLASAGDYMTLEALLAAKICKELVPELKIRYVNVSEISGICVGDFCNIYNPRILTQEGFNKFFTKDRSVIFNYHGYINDVEQILWNYANPKRFMIHGYSEEGSTTTPFDMAIRNKVSRYHLAMNLIEEGAKKNPAVAKQKTQILRDLQKKITAHHDYIVRYGDDPPEIKDIQWL